MKKVILLIAGIMVMSLVGCSSKKAEETTTEAETVEETSKEETAVNPWVDITEDEAKKEVPRLFKVPEGATNVSWQKYNDGNNADKAVDDGFVQVNFTLDNTDYCARAKYGAAEDEDISGMYYDWAATDEGKFSNWGSGNATYKSSSYVKDDSDSNDLDAMLIEWYDIEIGIKYSLSATGEDLNGLDISVIADSMYNADNEPLSSGTDSDE